MDLRSGKARKPNPKTTGLLDICGQPWVWPCEKPQHQALATQASKSWVHYKHPCSHWLAVASAWWSPSTRAEAKFYSPARFNKSNALLRISVPLSPPLSALLHSAYPSLGSVHLLTHTFFLSSPSTSSGLCISNAVPSWFLLPNWKELTVQRRQTFLPTPLRMNGIVVLESWEETLGERPTKFLLV